MKNKVVRAAAALFLLALFPLAFGCGDSRVREDGKRIVKVAYLPITHAIPVFATKEALDARDSDVVVELVKYGSWPELMDALNTGRVDAASALVELAMLARQNGIELSAVALGHKDGNILVTSNDITDPSQMKGKTFAIPHRQSSHYILLNDALRKAGLTIRDVRVVELAPPEMPSALASGQIAGYCVAEPFGAKAMTIKKDDGESVGRALYASPELWPDSLCCAFVVNDRFVAKRPDDAKILVNSYFDAGESLTKERAKELGKKYLNQDDEVLDLSLQWIAYDDLEITPKIYETLVGRVREYGLSKNPPSYDDFIDNSLRSEGAKHE